MNYKFSKTVYPFRTTYNDGNSNHNAYIVNKSNNSSSTINLNEKSQASYHIAETNNKVVVKDYLKDYKPFVDVISAKNISLQVSKAFIMCGSMGLLEYNMYLDKVMYSENEKAEIDEQYEKGEITIEQCVRLKQAIRSIPEVTVDGLVEKYWPILLESAAKFYFSSVLRKTYEFLSKSYFSKKLTSRLVKNVDKSFRRKLLKHGSLIASYRIFKTCLWGNSFLYFSSLSYDVINGTRKFFLRKDIKNIDAAIIKKNLLWFGKSFIISAVSLIGSSFGFAVGGYFFGVSVGAPLGNMVFEIVFSSVISSIIGYESNLIPRIDKAK